MVYSGLQVQEHKADIGKKHEISNQDQWWNTAEKARNQDLDL
jgi:hypothetical protein